MSAPSLSTEVAGVGKYPAGRFGQRERKLLESVKAYADSLAGTAAITKAQLGTGITFSHRVVAAGKFTTLGGDASEAITATGALSTDIAIVTVQTAGGTPRSIVSAVPAANAVNVTLSGDPSTDHILSWVVLRAST